MIVDRFWRMVWISFAAVALAGVVSSLSLFYVHTQPGDLLAALGVSYQNGKDPFESPLLSGAVSLNSGYFYQDALPLRYESWTWHAGADWRSNGEHAAGVASIKATFNAAGGSVGMQGPAADASHDNAISLYVRPDSNVGDLYLDLYDAHGNSIGRQSLSWYTASGALAAGEWQQVTVPLANFASDSVLPKELTGFSISAENPGAAYIDEVRLVSSDAAHARWFPPVAAGPQPFDPFATATPATLPYTFSPASDSLQKWYTYFGTFAPGASGYVELGPSALASTTGSMTMFRGGKDWVDYKVSTTVDWGLTSVFSLLVRMRDDGDFASCAFSRYGQTVQIYQVSGGVSQFISQSPSLPVRQDAPWEDVTMGAEITGSHVSCLIGGQTVLAADLPTLPTSGTVGFETWDPNPYASPHKLKVFEVAAGTGRD
ncbi:MAG TPA: hypothetical protein VG753_01370 [Candidatus Paceibacterota bacterium]|nr:hypothetical protein [Candidatus Paceibacterota bacterium]